MRRVLLVRQASTRATRRACFAPEDPLDAHGRDQAEALRAALIGAGDTVASPCLAAFQTASLARRGPVVTVGALADCDHGRWCGQTFDDVQREEPAAVDAWLADPDAVPHGGERVRALLTRVATWLDVQTQHAGVVVGRRSRSAAASTSRLSGCSPALDGRREARVPPPAAGRAAISGRCPTATSCASAPRRGGRNVDPPERTCRMLDEASAA